MRTIFSTTVPPGPAAFSFSPSLVKTKRIESIDFLRGVVMIIMALDHVRDYFHQDAFYYSPTDLSQTTVALFFTRWITHFCAPVFVFLAGTSAYLYGCKTSKKELSVFLLTRGLWLIFLELFILGLFRTFNPAFNYFVLQVIWAIGVSMIVLAGLVYLNRYVILLIGVALVGGHNLLDNVHVAGNNLPAFLWAVLHDVKNFTVGGVTIWVHYPLLPWIGVMSLGYFLGTVYSSNFDRQKRKLILFWTGVSAIILFVILRSGNFYGDHVTWSVQKNFMFSVMSFLNVTKYPPSLLYVLITLGPAMIFLSLIENISAEWKSGFVIFGRTPMFYYLAHILLIHIFASVGAVINGYRFSDMVLSSAVNDSPQLKGYGFGLFTVYLVWISLVIILYPLCKAYERYKRNHLSQQRWLSYL